MNTWNQVAASLAAGEALDYSQSYALMDSIMTGELGEVRLASYLSMLALRGLHTDELHGLADAMRDRARPVSLPSRVVDIVGTGGDQASTVNISTMAAIVIAATGTPVVKHGNRASTSASGSADVLEALGVNLALDPSQIEEVFPRTGLAFLFANQFHPSMRHAAPVRKQLGFPTAFNVLGPLTNPARPVASAIGVANAEVAPLVAGVFARRGDSALVFRGLERGLDELSTTESAGIWEVLDGEVTYREVDFVEALGLEAAPVESLRGGDPNHNALVAWDVFRGVEDGPIREAVLLNAAAGLVAADNAFLGAGEEDFITRLSQARDRASAAVDSGQAAQTLEEWIESTQL